MPGFTTFEKHTTNIVSRTVYLGHVPPNINIDRVIDQIKVGPLESVRFLPDKNCIFISFMSDAVALLFYHEAKAKKIFLRGQEVRVGWSKSSPVPEKIRFAFKMHKAS